MWIEKQVEGLIFNAPSVWQVVTSVYNFCVRLRPLLNRTFQTKVPGRYGRRLIPTFSPYQLTMLLLVRVLTAPPPPPLPLLLLLLLLLSSCSSSSTPPALAAAAAPACFPSCSSSFPSPPSGCCLVWLVQGVQHPAAQAGLRHAPPTVPRHALPPPRSAFCTHTATPQPHISAYHFLSEVRLAPRTCKPPHPTFIPTRSSASSQATAPLTPPPHDHVQACPTAPSPSPRPPHPARPRRRTSRCVCHVTSSSC